MNDIPFLQFYDFLLVGEAFPLVEEDEVFFWYFGCLRNDPTELVMPEFTWYWEVVGSLLAVAKVDIHFIRRISVLCFL